MAKEPSTRAIMQELAEQRQTMNHVIVILGGDPLVTDPNDPRHTSKSVMGRFDAGTRRMDATDAAVQSLVTFVQERFQKVEEDSFSWTKVFNTLKEHRWKIIGVGVLALLERQRILDVVRGLLHLN